MNLTKGSLLKGIMNFVMGIALPFVAGCTNPAIEDGVISATCQTSQRTKAVVVGMERSKFAGQCAGAGIDAERMNKVLSEVTTSVAYFSSESATKTAVASAMKDAVKESDLFIFYYSGHGGQGKFWDTGKDEVDGLDEYLCLYDTYMRDNEVWEIIKNAKCRVFLIFDCCHSQTMFQAPSPITLQTCVPMSATHNMSGNVELLVWSGCPDNTYSYGDANGGKLTNSILKNYTTKNLTYEYVWGLLESDAQLKKYESIQRTVIGSGFVGKQLFY